MFPTKHIYLKRCLTGFFIAALALLSACATPVTRGGASSTRQALNVAHKRLLADLHHRLIGTWLAIDKHGDLKAGTIAFESDGTTIIAPTGGRPLFGKWRCSLHKIHIFLPDNGMSQIRYAFSNTRPVFLTLRFKNGVQKNFARLPVHRE